MISIDLPKLSIDYTHAKTKPMSHRKQASVSSAGFIPAMFWLQHPLSALFRSTASPTHTHTHLYTHHIEVGGTGGKPETTGCPATREWRGVAVKVDVLKMMSNTDQ